jgi:hypothetical protein
MVRMLIISFGTVLLINTVLVLSKLWQHVWREQQRNQQKLEFD